MLCGQLAAPYSEGDCAGFASPACEGAQLAACTSPGALEWGTMAEGAARPRHEGPLTSVTMALDWTPTAIVGVSRPLAPNSPHACVCSWPWQPPHLTVHTLPGPGQGFYAAKALGYYEENGLDVTFISAHEDGFTTLPAERIDRKEVHFGIAPSETVVSYNVRPGSFHKSHMKVRAACGGGGGAAAAHALRGAWCAPKLGGSGTTCSRRSRRGISNTAAVRTAGWARRALPEQAPHSAS